jgi:hypothetical protein
MNETVPVLEARLGLIDRIRKVEQSLAREEQAREAARLLRGRSHDLGNAIQIVRLASIEIEKRGGTNIGDLVLDLRNAAESATTVLGELIAMAKPGPRKVEGVAIAPAVRAAVEQAQPGLAAQVDLRVELADMVKAPCLPDELETIVLCSLLDAARATKLGLHLRARAIEGKPWLELIRIDDRKDVSDSDFSRAFEPFATPGPGLHLVRVLAERCGGEASLSPGRAGLELVIALPVA